MPTQHVTLTPEQLQQVDRLCDRFEEAWRGGYRPQIDSFLEEAGRLERPVLLPELLALELEYRRKTGEKPALAEYVRRFPDHEEAVRDVFRRLIAAGLQTTTQGVGAAPGASSTAEHPTEPSGEAAPAKLELQPGVEPLPGFRLVGLLGKGGFGEVWQATAPGGFEVALKFVPLTQEEGRIELRALQVVRNIRHPNLLALFGAWQLGGYLIIAMELAEHSLMDRFKKGGEAGLPGAELLRYTREAATVLDFLNKPRHLLDGKKPVGIQHCDIKPQNLLVIGGGIKVADFGLATVVEQRLAERRGGLTPLYAPPEFFRGQISRHSDQYSLAVTYCHLRSGQPPFSGNLVEVEDGHLNRRPDLSRLSQAERRPLARALAKNPRERWPNCRAFAKALVQAKPAQALGPRPEAAGDLQDRPGLPSVAAQEDMTSPAAGAYTLDRLQGRGAFGEVWRGTLSGGRTVALKIIHRPEPEPAEREEERHALEQQEELVHPSLLRTVAFWQETGRLVIATELADQTLRDRLQEHIRSGRQGIPASELLEYVQDAAAALDFLHSKGVLHSDIKPDNLLLVEGRVKLADFHLDRILGHWPEATGADFGTFAYLAPEGWAGRRVPASDQYSLACVYAELRLARPIYAYSELRRIMLAHMKQEPDLAGMKPEEQRVLLKALSKDPANRYASCRDFVRDLRLALEGPPLVVGTKPRPPGTPESETASVARQTVPLVLPAAGRATSTAAAPRRPARSADRRLDAPATWRQREERRSRSPRAAQWPLWIGLCFLLALALGAFASSLVFFGPTTEPGILDQIMGYFEGWSWPIWLALGLALILALVGLWVRKRHRHIESEQAEPGREPAHVQDFATEEAEQESLGRQFAMKVFPRNLRNVELETKTLGTELLGQPGQVRRLQGHTDSVWSVAVSGNGRWAVSGSMDRTVRLWDLETGRELRELRGHEEGVTSLALFIGSVQGVLSGGLDNEVRLWHMATGEEIRRLRGHTGGVTGLATSLDSRWVLSASLDHTVRLWDLATARELARFNHDTSVWSVALSPDGRIAACGIGPEEPDLPDGREEDCGVVLWTLPDGPQMRRLHGHTAAVRCVAFTPDGRFLFSGSADATIRQWDLDTGQELRVLAGHEDWVRGVACSPDGRRLLSAGDDETVRLWDVWTGAELQCFEGYDWSVTSVAFTPDGRQALSGSDDTTLILWQLS